MVREEARRAWRELRGGNTSPGRAALAVAIGLFVGSQPIFGCHTPIVLFLCVWFRLDAALCWLASNISNPFFAPFLITAEIHVGSLLWTGAPVPVDAAVIRETGATGFAGFAFLGAPIVGLSLSAVGGGLVFGLIRGKRWFFPRSPKDRPNPYQLPENAPPWVGAVERVASRYAPPEDSTPAQRTRFHYVRVKLLGDPVAKLIADIAGDVPGVLGEVFDIGTGRGQLPILLVELGRASRARGIDWDLPKIEDARAAAATPPAVGGDFAQGDARVEPIDPADTVLLIDVLHYLSIKEQDALLARAADAVRPGGRLIVREADTERGWRSKATLIEERIFTALKFNRGERVCFRPARDVVAILEAHGLVCRMQPAWGKTPFANVLIVGNRTKAPHPA